MKQVQLTDKIHIIVTGTDFGSCKYGESTFKDQIKRLQTVTETTDLTPILVYSKFTTHVFTANQIGQASLIYDPEMEIHSTPVGFDGIILPSNAQQYSALQVNADCPAIILYKADGTIANLHGGLNCIEREDGNSIIKEAVEIMGNNDLYAFVCAGARECCFGHLSTDPQIHAANLKRASRIANRFGNEVVCEVQNPPRQGGIGYNMFKIIRTLLNQNGVPDSRIQMDDCCTSCNGLTHEVMATPGHEGAFFSNLRQTTTSSKGGRNAVYVWCN